MTNQTIEIRLPKELTEQLNSLQRGINELLALARADSAASAEWLTSEQIMDKLHIGRTTLSRMANDGRLERKNYGGRIVRFREVPA